jgi:hypothetical protein
MSRRLAVISNAEAAATCPDGDSPAKRHNEEQTQDPIKENPFVFNFVTLWYVVAKSEDERIRVRDLPSKALS